MNRGLERLTGYRLEKPRPAPKKRKPPKLPKDFDRDAKQIIRAVRPWTMTAPDKLFALIEAVRYVSRYGIEGDIVECGVWRGGSMQAAARTLAAASDTSRDLYLFDTYKGMPPPTERDTRRGDGRAAADLLATQSREKSKVWAVASLDDVRDGFSRIDYPAERVHFVKGQVEDTIPDSAPERIAILRLDTDWYESTRHELEHLYPRLSAGGVLIVDDYGHWEGCKRAVDEYFDGRPGYRIERRAKVHVVRV